MEGLVTFLKIFFLGKVILLTPVPLDVGNRWLELKLDKPLSVVTSGASLEVRISRQHYLFNKTKGFNEIYDVAKTALPEGTIVAELIDKNGNKINLSRRVLSISNDYVSYGITANVPLLSSTIFNGLKIKSNISIEGVKVYWRNYKH